MMSPLRTFIAAAVMTATVGVTAPAHAQTTTHTTLASFLAGTQGPTYTETFTGSGPVAEPSFSFSSLGFGYTVTAATNVYRSGSIIGTNLPNELLTFTFTTGNVSAVGGNFFIASINDVFQAQPVTILLSNGTTTTFTPSSASDFRGFTTTNGFITSLTMSAPTGGQFYNSADNIIVGTAAGNVVPEPSTFAMLGAGLVGLIGAAKRRKRVS